MLIFSDKLYGVVIGLLIGLCYFLLLFIDFSMVEVV